MARVANSGLTDVGIAEGTTWETQTKEFNPFPVVLVEIDFPSGSRYFSGDAIRFSERFYEGRLIGLGSFRRALQQNLGLFEVASVDAILADTDRELIDLTKDDAVKGALARFKLGDTKLPLSLYETIFEGRIDDFGSQDFTFRVLVRDRMYTMPAKPNTGYVDLTSFPYALPTDVGKPLPFVYGVHSFVDTDDPAYPETSDAKLRGAWPTLYVDTREEERVFLIAGHAVKSIDQVYAYTTTGGSQLLTPTTDYIAYKNGTLNGKTMAFVKLTSTGFAKLVESSALGVLTVNIQGKEENGDGSGALITNPVLVLHDILGNYLGSPEINGEKFAQAEAIAEGRGYIASGGYTQEIATDQLFKEICDSFQIRIFPDRNGKIAVSIFNPISPFSLGLKIREQWEIIKGSMNLEYKSDIQGSEDAQIVNSIDYKYSTHWAKSAFRGSGKSQDADSISTYGEKVLVMDMPWAKDADTASDVARRMIALYKNPVAHMQCTVPLTGMNLEITDTISFTHSNGPDGGFENAAFEVIEHTFNPQNFTVDIRAKDVSPVVGQSFFFDDEELRIVSEGSADVTNASGNIDIDGGTSDVQVGDIIRLKDPTNGANRGSYKVTAVVDSDTVTVANTVWTTESGITYDIIPSWLTKSGGQVYGGHLCDDSSGEFSNGDEGLEMQ